MTRLVVSSACPALGDAVALALGVAAERLRVERFANENLLCDASHLRVEGEDVALLTTSRPPVSDGVLELLLSLDALRARRPRRLTLALAYAPYARSDRPSAPGGPTPLRLLADLLQRAGLDRVVAVDLHAPHTVGFFSAPVLEVSARDALVEALRRAGVADAVVVSPDLGGAKRAAAVADALGAPLAVARKERRAGGVRALALLGEVSGRDVVIVDDEVATGGTVLQVTERALERGARSVWLAATHAVLVPGALERLLAAPLRRLIFSDTLPIPGPLDPRVEVVSIAPHLATALAS